MGAVTEYGHKATRHPGFGPATLLAKCLESIDPAEKTEILFSNKLLSEKINIFLLPK